MAGSSLDTLFDEFDKDSDGHLTAAEIASALNSRGVLITEQEAAMFIRGDCWQPLEEETIAWRHLHGAVWEASMN